MSEVILENLRWSEGKYLHFLDLLLAAAKKKTEKVQLVGIKTVNDE